MNAPPLRAALDELGVLRIAGRDAGAFLQGQLSVDVTQLTARGLLWAGLHSPQGRVIAVLRLLPAAEDAIHAVLPRELMSAVAAHLKRFVVRSQVTVDEAPALRALGMRVGDGPLRYAVDDSAGDADLTASEWQRLEISAGLPEVYAATREKFVAQNLNLDCIDAISWTKGCYTGQEIIARAHYRGRVKRRMQRFAFDAPPPLPGTQVTLPSGETALVVRAAYAEGASEVLAVAPLGVASLPLPYPLPE